MGYAGSELHHKDLEHEDEGVEISVGVEVTEVIGGRFRDPTDATRTCAALSLPTPVVSFLKSFQWSGTLALRASKHYHCRSSA